MVLGIQPIHIIGFVISLGLFYQSIRLVRKRKENILEFLFWTSFGCVLLLLTLTSALAAIEMRALVKNIARFIGFSSGFEGLLVVSVLALLLALFYTYIITKTNQKRLYDLSQEIALTNYKMEQQQESDSESSVENQRE